MDPGASLTLARDDSTSTRRPRPRLREDRLQRGPIRRSNIEKLRSMDPGASLALARDDRGTMAPGVCPRAGGEGNERGLVCAREITIGS